MTTMQLMITFYFDTHLDEKHPAMQVYNVLTKSGHSCLFAGGWVRDLVMGKTSNDVDIATSATPDEVIASFKRSLPLGKRFGSVVVLIGNSDGSTSSVEVTTFRSDGEYIDGRRPISISTASAKEDAQRRDFTINGLFYDPKQKTIYDYVGGLEDIKRRVLRAVGVPSERFAEDRLRILRAVRFSSRFNFDVEPLTLKAIAEHAPYLLESVSIERVWQELQKMHEGRHLLAAFVLMQRLGLLEVIFKTSLDQPDLLEKLTYLSAFEEMDLIHMLAALYPLYGGRLSLFALERLYFFKISTHNKKSLEQLDKGLQLFKEDRDLFDRYRWMQWLKNPSSSLHLIWIHYMTGANSAWAEKIKRLKSSSYFKKLLKEGHAFGSQELKLLGARPGKAFGQLLELAERAAEKMDTLNTKVLSAHLQADPISLALLKKSQRVFTPIDI